MGIPLDVFSLYELRGEDAGCVHHLLLRVGQRAFSNADAGDYDSAVEAAEEKRRSMVEAYRAGALAGECGARHAARLAGELQSAPVGGLLSEGRGGFYVDLWVAATRFGHPWVLMGTAADEGEFWREAARDEDLSGLGARGPARKLRAYFLAE